MLLNSFVSKTSDKCELNSLKSTFSFVTTPTGKLFSPWALKETKKLPINNKGKTSNKTIDFQFLINSLISAIVKVIVLIFSSLRK